jgi:hypothetical protein
MRHPNATTVACLIAAERMGGLEEKASTVIGAFFEDWSDERKADLYARLAESLLPADTIAVMTEKCSTALWANQNECLCG